MVEWEQRQRAQAANAAAEARERAWAQQVAAARRAAQAQQAETTGPRTIEDYEALRRNLPSYRPQPSQAAYEALRQNLPSYAPAPQEKKPLSKALDTVVGLSIAAVSNIRDLSTRPNVVTSATTMFNSLRYLANPSIDPNPTWAAVRSQQFAREIERGLVTNPDDVWRGFEEIARTSRPGAFNYTTLANFVESTKDFVPSAVGLGSFALSAYGASTGNKNAQATGDVTGGAVSVLQGIQTFGNQTLIAKTTTTLLGRTSTVGLGITGGLQFFSSAFRLATDQSINPVAGGQWNDTTWIERVGVATTGISGAFLFAGAIAAFVPGGQAVAAVLLPAGLAFAGAGAIMQNWGWVSSTASQISKTVQQWTSNAASVPSNPPGAQTVPAPTPPPPSSTPSATSTPPPPGASSQSTPAAIPVPQAPSPNPSVTPTQTPHP